MRYYLFILNLIVFLIAWLGITGYTFVALFNPLLPYSLALFAIFLVLLNLLGLPLMWFWYCCYPRTIQLQTAVGISTLIFIFFWGPFAPVHSVLSLHLDNAQLRWIAFAYIWEVVIIGAMVVLAVLFVTKFAHRFLNDSLPQGMSFEVTHAKIAGIPLQGSIIYALMVIFGYAIGSAQLFFFSQFPLSEVIKNFTNGVVAGILSSFILLFLLERIISPALEKSGSLIEEQNIKATPSRKFSLFIKIYSISALLVLVSLGVLGTTAYGRGQAILEEQLAERVLLELAVVQHEFERIGGLPDRKELGIRFGQDGNVFVLPRPRRDTSPITFTERLPEYQEIFDSWGRILESPHLFINRSERTKIAATYPINDFQMLAAIVFLDDFDDSLNATIFSILAIFLITGLFIATLGTFFARSITLPIREIREGGVRIGRGDFSKPITVYTNDELEDLSKALNDASKQLELSYARLEEEIRARTVELAKANERQEDQIKELDRTSRLLVRRDFDLQQANNLLRELDQAKTQFVSVAAHQLRTPLSVSKWTYQMLLSEDFGTLTQEQREVLERGDAMNEQMIHLVSDLLDVARIESGKIVYDFQSIELSSYLVEIEDLYRERAREKQIILNIIMPEKGTIFIKADPLRLKMVFQNIIDNAFKFTPAGGSITLSWQVKREMVEFSITDTGIGISKEDASRLFTKFFRGRKAMLMDTSGTGLGLYIVSSIIRTHGGRIWVKSEEGKGSTFFFNVPLFTAK